jgi:uncharacterized tellurite resistance protein B-like protein
MIDRLMSWLKDGDGDIARGGRDDVPLAVAALLLETAVVVDCQFDAHEREVVAGLLQRGFNLTPAAAQQLMAAAEQRVAASAQLFGFTSTVNDKLTAERKIEVIEMLWEVAYADGVLDPLEDTLLRRIAGLIDVSDHERGAAKRRVLQRLGLQPAQ